MIRRPFAEMKSAKRRRTIVEGPVSRIGPDTAGRRSSAPIGSVFLREREAWTLAGSSQPRTPNPHRELPSLTYVLTLSLKSCCSTDRVRSVLWIFEKPLIW